MYIFEAVLELQSGGQWKLALFLPEDWGHEMEYVESSAGLNFSVAQNWATDVIRAKGFPVQFGWRFIRDDKWAIKMTVQPPT